MEANSVIHKPKRQKLNEKQGIEGQSKCFGNLPDVVLRHILSFLPIKDAVRTSVLSKRWEFLWTSNPNLNFGEAVPGMRRMLMYFVERVLYLRGSSDIKEFLLDFDVECDASLVKSWITAAVRRNVQTLSLCLWDLRRHFSLPPCVFSCKTLRSFFLDMPSILKIPSRICFSNLEILSITGVTFLDGNTTQQLFSGLPALEVLYLENCRWGCRKVLSISAPKLHSLTIIEAHMQDPSDCQFKILGATLKCFLYTGEFFNEYCFYDSFSLERADFDVVCCGKWASNERARQVAYRMFKVLLSIPNVKDLRLYGIGYEVLAYAPELLPKMPIFNNLWYLKLGTLNLECAALLKILQNSPCLETLKFFEGPFKLAKILQC
ncbi:F-box/LRR-repeat protein At3g59190-like isoform X2 [Corylus avellana]|uniref:F-box/LRR-repeat protein At3g59190-like isoform X2 n=1 Tax=Corylus avellana TaxID=13451 RepID=UPI00286C66AC|nr:F-box/LRR-repeat protein At3g59190-like isoform X2 [Corylus avellana]